MLIPYRDQMPQVSPGAFLADGAMLIGNVTVGPNANIWYNAVLRADRGEIIVGDFSSVQDCCVLHGPVQVGSHVIVGHAAVLHGATIEDNCVIGMNAVVLDNANVGHGSIVAAGAVVAQGMQVPPRSMVAGVPAKIVKELPAENEEFLRKMATDYFEFARPHMGGRA